MNMALKITVPRQLRKVNYKNSSNLGRSTMNKHKNRPDCRADLYYSRQKAVLVHWEILFTLAPTIEISSSLGWSIWITQDTPHHRPVQELVGSQVDSIHPRDSLKTQLHSIQMKVHTSGSWKRLLSRGEIQQPMTSKIYCVNRILTSWTTWIPPTLPEKTSSQMMMLMIYLKQIN